MESLEELKEINKEHQLLNGELSFKLGKLECENEILKEIVKKFNRGIDLTDIEMDYVIEMDIGENND